MASINETRDLARKLGLHVPSSLSGRDQMRLIAAQIGIKNYTYSPKNLDELYNKLKDLKIKGTIKVKVPDMKVAVPSNNDNYENEYEVLDLNETSISKDKQYVKDKINKIDDIYKQIDENNDEIEKLENEIEEDNKELAKKDLTLDDDLEDEDNDDEDDGDDDVSPYPGGNPATDRLKDKFNRNNDPTANAKKNLIQRQRARAGNNPIDRLKDENKEAAKNEAKKAAKASGSFFKEVVIPFIMKNPWILAALGIAVLFVIILIIIISALGGDSGNNDSGGYRGNHCSYELEGVVNTGYVTLNDVQVELINCGGTEESYEVLETVDLEKYSLGVALAELHLADGLDTAPIESIKAQTIIARNFALTRNQSMCPDDPENCFYGYNISTGKIRLRSCELDQIYWDYDRDAFVDSVNGVLSYYGEEADIFHYALDEDESQYIIDAGKDVKGKVLLNNDQSVMQISDSYGVVESVLEYGASEDSYAEILGKIYGISNIRSSECSSLGNIDFSNYVLSSDGDQILHESLSGFLSSKGSSLESFNSIIEKNVKKAGYATRAGVVAAGVTLVAELGNVYGVKVPYFWGGGHSGSIDLYANATWGSSACHTTANGQNYNYCGLDCTGFVAWALYNGGFIPSTRTNFTKMDGAKRVSLKDDYAVVQPGDLLESSGHAVLVVGVDDKTKQYICVEASGNEYGIQFTRRSFGSTGYWGVNLDDFYNDSSKVRG